MVLFVATEQFFTGYFTVGDAAFFGEYKTLFEYPVFFRAGVQNIIAIGIFFQPCTGVVQQAVLVVLYIASSRQAHAEFFMVVHIYINPATGFAFGLNNCVGVHNAFVIFDHQVVLIITRPFGKLEEGAGSAFFHQGIGNDPIGWGGHNALQVFGKGVADRPQLTGNRPVNASRCLVVFPFPFTGNFEQVDVFAMVLGIDGVHLYGYQEKKKDRFHIVLFIY